MAKKERFTTELYLLAMVAIVAAVGILVLVDLPDASFVGQAGFFRQPYTCDDPGDDILQLEFADIVGVDKPQFSWNLADTCLDDSNQPASQGLTLVQFSCKDTLANGFRDLTERVVLVEDTPCNCQNGVCVDEPTCTDADSDGYYSTNSDLDCSGQRDCNDNDASINPGASEICSDNKDNNCDGQIDEGCSSGQSQRIKNYMILTSWGAFPTPPENETAFFADRYDMAQEYRDGVGRMLIAAGARSIIKYRLGGFLWNETHSLGNDQREPIYLKATGQGPAPFTVDLRMKKVGGGHMLREDKQIYLLDLSTQQRRDLWAQILIESLEEYLEQGQHEFHGVFFDVANIQLDDIYPGTQDPEQPYSIEDEHRAIQNVYEQVKDRFGDKTVILNAHSPWNSRSIAKPQDPNQLTPNPPDYTSRRLVENSGSDGVMTEARMLASGGPSISAWTRTTMHDTNSILEDGNSVIVTYQLGRSATNFAAQRHWSLATFLIASGGDPDAYYGMEVHTDNGLPDFPEQEFDIGLELGDKTSGIIYEGDGQVYRRNFENGIVFAHVQQAFGPQDKTITIPDVPGGYERLVLSGGGDYPDTDGRIDWVPISSGPFVMQSPQGSIKDSSSLILRRTN